MDISLISSGPRPSYTLPTPAPSVDQSANAAPSSASTQASVPQVQDAAPNLIDQDTQRRQAVEHSAQALKEASFPVRDSTFTIFKDSSGQYITRFTSLRDGKVTYLPEQSMFSYFQKIDGRKTLVSLHA